VCHDSDSSGVPLGDTTRANASGQQFAELDESVS
jgi:hypothetical protein